MTVVYPRTRDDQAIFKSNRIVSEVVQDLLDDVLTAQTCGPAAQP